jgi:ATP-dependent metalloprotease
VIWGLIIGIGYHLFTSPMRSDDLTEMIMPKTPIKPEEEITTRFSDVLGIDEFKEELLDIVDYLKNPDVYL